MEKPVVVRFGAFELDAQAGCLQRDGLPVPLRARPMALLQAFLARPGELLTKDALLASAWPGLVVEENNLQVQVSVLRKLLGSTAIATVPGRGYRFGLPVERAAGPLPGVAPAAGPDALIGRDEDLAQLQSLLAKARLVSVVGAGGVGKTCLARAAARAGMSGRVLWIDLAEIGDAALLPAFVLDRVQAGRPDAAAAPAGVAALAAALGREPTRLVLDNAEHLLAGVAGLVDALLAAVPALQVLVTSQVPLRLTAERVLRLAPLAVPASGDQAGEVDEADEAGAVALFVQRVQCQDARFRLDASTRPLVVEVCRRLDGLPLALELAAARVPAFGLRKLAELLDERFRLLNTGPRGAPPRHKTLQAVYDWTYALLDDDERRVFRRLGVLGAPRALDDLVQLLRLPDDPQLDAWRCVDALAALVERSLLQMDDADPPRYTVLESARAYAMGLLRAEGEHAVLAHASEWVESAGDRAAQAAGGTQALVEFGAALDLLRLLPPSPARDARELRLCLKLGPAIQATLGPSHPRCEAVYLRSVELARGAPPGPEPFQALWGHWQFLTLAGRDREAAQSAREIGEMAPALGDDGYQLEAWHAEMTTADLLGDAPAVVEHAERIAAMYVRCRHHPLTFAFGGHDPGVCALGQGSVNHWLCGRPEAAEDMARRALALASTLDHGYSRATGAYYASITFAALGQHEALARTADALVRLSDEYGMAMLLTEGRFFQGCARHAGGDAAGLDQMREALEAIEASRDLGFVFVYMALYAQALLASGRADEVLSLVERALGHAAQGQRLFLPELLRLRALARQQGGDAGWSEDAHEALRMAQEQGAVALAERARALLQQPHSISRSRS